MMIEVNDALPILPIEDKDLPKNWRIPENIKLKEIGDRILSARKHIAIKARSAVLPGQCNYILNLEFPHYYKHVRVINVEPLEVAKRFFK